MIAVMGALLLSPALWAAQLPGGAAASAAPDAARDINGECGCAPERFVRGAFGTYWADADAPATKQRREHVAPRVYALDAAFFRNPASIATPPLAAERLELAGAAGRHALYRTDPSVVGPGQVLGMVRDGETTPREVQKRIPEAALKSAAAQLVWLGPRFAKSHPTCRDYETIPLLSTAAEGARRPDAYRVEFTDAAGRVTTHLVDERHARTFGLGRVPVCGHGAPLPSGAFTARISGIDVQTGATSGPFVFAYDAAGAPSSLSDALDDDDNPFLSPMPGRTLGHEEDKAALVMMLGVGGGAFAFAFVLWPLVRRRRRRLEDVACPACHATLTLDLNDPKTDGIFCPKCGGASIFIRTLADGAPLATAVILDHAAHQSPPTRPPASSSETD